MIKNQKALSFAAIIFIAAEIALGIILQTSGGYVTRYSSFGAIVLACLFCALFAERSTAYIFTQTALVFTVCADYFLIITPVRRQLPGMLFFSVVQLAYFLRIYLADENKTRRKWHVISRAAASVIAVSLTFIVLGSSADAVAVVSMFYYANLVINLIFAFIDFKRSPALAVGFLLFALCDTVIGLSFLDGYVSVPADSFIYKIIHPGFDLAWGFYLPAQTLLALSLMKKSPDK